MNRTTYLPALIVLLVLQVVAPILIGGGGAENLLANPGFEGDYAPFDAFGTALVAEGWTPWWQPQSARDPAWRNRMPEFKPAAPYTNRVRSGSNAQQLFTAYGTHIGGVYQVVEDVQPGSVVHFTIWGHAWAGEGDDPDRSEHGGPVRMSIGIDPTGGRNPFSSRVIWSSDQNPLDEWALFEVEVVALGRSVTVFTRSAPEFPTRHNDVYWDDARLIVTQHAPAPTATPRIYFEAEAMSAPASTSPEWSAGASRPRVR